MIRTLAALTLALLMNSPLHAGPREAQWKRVEEAAAKGLPKTAIEELAPILQGALADHAWAEATKALATRIAFEGMIQGNKPEERILRLQAELAKAPKEMTPMLDTVLAHWYWQFFQQNRWRFMQRTATAQPPGKDFTTWDLPRLFAEIDAQFQKALVAEKILKATPIAVWNDLLPKGALPDACRPTLYDFVAQEALAFYISGEQAAAKPEDAFTVPVDSPVFGPVTEFLAWQPVTTDTNAPALKAIRLYQALLRFHLNDAEPSALLDADLARLVWAKNVAAGEDKNERFKAALKVLADKYGDHDLASMVLWHWATTLREEDKLTEAHALAERGRNAHPHSAGGKLCGNLIAEIEARAIDMSTERIWNAPWPKIRVAYRNVTNVWFRAVAGNWDEFLDKRHRRPENLTDAERKAILAQAPAREWSAALRPTTDYKTHTLDLPAPTDLKPGFYFIVASGDPTFGEHNNQLSLADIWVSDLAFVLRTRDDLLEGFVLRAESGQPIPAARVQAWFLDRTGNRVPVPERATDTNGFFALEAQPSFGYVIKVTAGDQSVASGSDVFVWNRRGVERPYEQTIFFTDRAIYRPGQTVSYKGICVAVDTTIDNYATIAGRAMTVVFYDGNGKEIASQSVRANDYGSFAGSFTAPRDRVLGRMRISTKDGPQGTAWVNVEEYKRPKFQVTLDLPKVAAKLNEKTTVTGHAMNYTGAATDGATVQYRIIREVEMPWWWGWWRGGFRPGESQEIAHGTARTGADGSFPIEFVAKPDPQVPEKDEPTFVFRVHADVTDAAGETRSADQQIRLGYTALQARLSAENWLTDDQPVELKVLTTTLDGTPQTAEGVVKVYALKAPDRVQRPSLAAGGTPQPDDASEPELADVNQWPQGPVVFEHGFTTDKEGKTTLSVKLPAGDFRALLETQDRFGKKVTGRLALRVLQPAADRFTSRIPHLLEAPAWSVEPGQEFMALWGTGYETGRAFVEIEHRGKMIQRFWTPAGVTQAQIKQTIGEAMRGGFTLHVTFVRENCAYLESRRVDVPWSNKELVLKWEHFTSKLQPGQKETWTLAIQGPKVAGKLGGPAAAELVATLYDASLDAFAPLNWPAALGGFRMDYSNRQVLFGNDQRGFGIFRQDWPVPNEPVELTYRTFPPELAYAPPMRMMMRYGLAAPRRAGAMQNMMLADSLAEAPMPAAAARLAFAAPDGKAMEANMAKRVVVTGSMIAPGSGGAIGGGSDKGGAAPDLNKVAARKILNETAFFFPQLVSDSNGVVRLSFTMPEGLTEWRFLGFAHDNACRAGQLFGETVTAKDLMVQPNPPRFLREGDAVEFTVKVSNQSDQRQRGKVRLTLNDAWTEKSADALLGNKVPEQAFDIPAKESRSFAWRLAVPDGFPALSYKAVAASDQVSDGEEGVFPVLSRRILVTESLPLPIRGPATKQFDFKRLEDSGKSTTLRHQSLTVQMVSNPAWYAVMALPYLMEFPYECAEQTFNRFYANALARTIANSDPKIHRVFELWRATPALDSPLEKNQDLKSVAIEETPWLRQAQNESQARKNVGLLFEDNRLNAELALAFQKLAEGQLGDGAWPWFPGGPANDYITLYITTGFGRLRQLGADVQMPPALRSLDRLDNWMREHHDRILKDWRKPEDYVPGATDALYLYGRSFFLKDKPVAAEHRPAVDFFLQQARRHWLKTGNRQTQAHLAIALQRFNLFNSFNDSTPMDIMKSLKERSVTDPEMGRFWREDELSWWWYHAPIETQALLIEAFGEVAHDDSAVEECKVWLLKQKQTQDWKTTKATADAIYALLLRGRNLLASDKLVEVKLGNLDVTPGAKPVGTLNSQPSTLNRVEPGTGFYERRFAGPEIKPAMGRITVKKLDDGVAWGSVHWQYLEDMTKVTPYAGTPLKLKKTLFTRKNTAKGPVLEAVKGPLAVGDELVVRIELRVDRDMEYVHLKDERGSGTEPVNVLSGYRYQDGLGYYESTRDTASHFFIDYLPKGTYVFEYATRIQLRGQYQTGVAGIQCMYAPEFNSHSESFNLVVK